MRVTISALVALADPAQHHRGVEAARVEQQHAPDLLGIRLVGGDPGCRDLAHGRGSVACGAGRSPACRDPRSCPLVRRALYILSVALITAGIVIAADVAMTLAWREPLSTIYGSIQQSKAADSLDKLKLEFPEPAEVHDTGDRSRDDRRPREPARGRLRRARSRPATESAGSRSRRSGSTSSSSRAPTPQACRRAPGTTRTRPSRARAGRSASPATGRPTWPRSGRSMTSPTATRSRSRCRTGRSSTWSKSTRSSIPSQVEIVDDVGYERLVLTACHPLYSAAQRWAVFAKLERIESLSSG